MALPNTHMGPEAIGALLDGKKNLFFDGIGGIVHTHSRYATALPLPMTM